MKPLRILTITGASICGALAAGTVFAPEPGGQPQAGHAAATGLHTGLYPVTQSSAGDRAADEQGSANGSDARIAAAGLTGRPEGAMPAPSQHETTDGACAPQLSMTALPHAMIAVEYQAPCLSEGASVTLAHGPLSLTETLDAEGRLALVLPALAPEARVAITPGAAGSNTPEIANDIVVADFADHARLVLQWQGSAELELNAFETGAEWGGPGHIHAASAPSHAGFVTALGSADAAQALILTYPAETNPHDGRISVEAELVLNASSCGQSVSARALLVQSDAPVSGPSIDLETPACGAAEGFIFLGNILPDAFQPDLLPDPTDPDSNQTEIELAGLGG